MPSGDRAPLFRELSIAMQSSGPLAQVYLMCWHPVQIQNLQNNKLHCLQQERVSKWQMMITAPFSAQKTVGSPVVPDPMHSKVGIDPSYSCKIAIIQEQSRTNVITKRTNHAKTAQLLENVPTQILVEWWNTTFHQYHLPTEVRLWIHSWNFPVGKLCNTHITKMHVRLVYNATALIKGRAKTHLETDVGHRFNFAKVKFNKMDTHCQDACQAGIRCHSPPSRSKLSWTRLMST